MYRRWKCGNHVHTQNACRECFIFIQFIIIIGYICRHNHNLKSHYQCRVWGMVHLPLQSAEVIWQPQGWMEHRSSNCSNRASRRGAHRHPGQKTYNTDSTFPWDRRAYTCATCIWIQDFLETRKGIHNTDWGFSLTPWEDLHYRLTIISPYSLGFPIF